MDVTRGDPMLADLVRRGEGTAVGPAGTGRIGIDADTYGIRLPTGDPDPTLLAMGAFASGGAIGLFSRPGTNASFFRQNDRVVRWIINRLSAVSAGTRR
jgi:hypothetical protein